MGNTTPDEIVPFCPVCGDPMTKSPYFYLEWSQIARFKCYAHGSLPVTVQIPVSAIGDASPGDKKAEKGGKK